MRKIAVKIVTARYFGQLINLPPYCQHLSGWLQKDKGLPG
jgi:hypothetical protein